MASFLEEECAGPQPGRAPAGGASAKKRDPLIQVAFLQVVPELAIDVVADFARPGEG